jgi:hypothetical protein
LKCFAVSRSWARGGAVLVAALAIVAEFAFAHSVHAQQFVAADLTYTATTQNTTNSEYRIPVLAGVPANWKSPVDYTQGMAYVRFEVLDKPSDAKTVYNVCFALAGSTLSCMPYSPVFTAKGVNNFSAPFSAFWNGDMVDWTMGVMQIVLVLKDDTGKLVQGDANYYPSTIKTHLTIVAPGATYVPPNTSDAGTTIPKDAGLPMRDASTAQDAGAPKDAAVSVQDAGAPSVVDAGKKPLDAGRLDAATTIPAADSGSGTGNSSSSLTEAMAGASSPMSTQDAAPEHDVRNYLKSSGDCSIARAAGGGASNLWLLSLALPLIASRIRSRIRSRRGAQRR